MECPKCGMQFWNDTKKHSDTACAQQQEINRKNKCEPCPWCGNSALAGHKVGCPRTNLEKKQ